MKQIAASLVAGAITASMALAVLQGQAPSEARVESYGYYLFVHQPVGCEECYVPLLLMSKRLEDVAKQKSDEPGVLITTYERDSIVGAPRAVVVTARNVKPQERHVFVRDRWYRYQQVSASQVLGLLEHPEGVLPISRIPEMRIPTADELAELIARFRSVK